MNHRALLLASLLLAAVGLQAGDPADTSRLEPDLTPMGLPYDLTPLREPDVAPTLSLWVLPAVWLETGETVKDNSAHGSFSADLERDLGVALRGTAYASNGFGVGILLMASRHADATTRITDATLYSGYVEYMVTSAVPAEKKTRFFSELALGLGGGYLDFSDYYDSAYKAGFELRFATGFEWHRLRTSWLVGGFGFAGRDFTYGGFTGVELSLRF
jgi:hypothetical protein